MHCSLFFSSRTVGISIFLEYLYYNDAELRVIKQINKYTGGKAVSVNMKPMAKPPIEIKVVHDLNQPMADSQNSGQSKTHMHVVLDTYANNTERNKLRNYFNRM